MAKKVFKKKKKIRVFWTLSNSSIFILFSPPHPTNFIYYPIFPNTFTFTLLFVSFTYCFSCLEAYPLSPSQELAICVCWDSALSLTSFRKCFQIFTVLAMCFLNSVHYTNIMVFITWFDPLILLSCLSKQIIKLFMTKTILYIFESWEPISWYLFSNQYIKIFKFYFLIEG